MRYLFVLLIFAVSCSTNQNKEPAKPKPIASFGCSKYKGKDWEKCMISLVGKLENIVNLEPKKNVLSSERVDNRFILVRYEYCFGENDLCFQESEYVYDPTIIGKAISFIEPMSLGVVFGVIIGVYIP